jgi:hypothetical protein
LDFNKIYKNIAFFYFHFLNILYQYVKIISSFSSTQKLDSHIIFQKEIIKNGRGGKGPNAMALEKSGFAPFRVGKLGGGKPKRKEFCSNE